MRSSETTKEIGPALAKALASLKNPPNTASNPFFKSKYAALPDILNMVRPILGKHGLALIQSTQTNGGPGIVTRLMHESGEWLESDPLTVTPTKDDPQGIGGALTYARRYSLCAMLGISGEDDDDANYASSPRESSGEGHHERPGSGEFITTPQMKLIQALCGKASDPEATRQAIREKFGITTLNELRKSQASAVIESLKAKDEKPDDDFNPEDIPF